jgi:eukaryotic-like serine/threonine-protein kinase
LWVVPNSVVESRKVTDPSEALKTLGANLVVKGAVERDGTGIHLTANLIDTKTLRQIGSVDVDDPAGDLSTLEDETVAKLAQLMNIKVTAGMLRNTGGRVDPAAYEGYLKALGYIDRYDKPGNLDDAIAALQQATQTDPNFALGYAAMGEAYRLKYQVSKDQRWLAEGEAEAQKAAEIDNSIPAVYVTLGRIHNVTGKHDLAMQEFQRALQLDPRNADAEAGLAMAYENAGRIHDAEAAYQKAAAMRPDAWVGYESLGAFYDRQNMYPQAVAADQRAIELSPDNAQVYSNLGGAAVDSGDPKLLPIGEQALRKSIQLSPSYPAYTNLGNLLLLEHRGAEAEAALKEALKFHAGDYNTWSSLMMAYEWQKKDADASAARHHAITLAEQSVKLQPTDAFAQSTLAYLYAEDKQNENAAARIQAALALSPNDPNVLCNVGQAYENMGDRAKALEYIEGALRKGYPLVQMQAEPTLQKLLQDPALHIPHK